MIEKKDGEDAEAGSLDSNITTVEIQVKNTGADEFSSQTLSECLFHFPEYSDKNSLLARLCIDEKRVLIIATSSTCSNELIGLKRGLSSSIPYKCVRDSQSHISISNALESFSTQKLKSLGQRRLSDFRRVTQSFSDDSSKLSSIIDRIILVDDLTKDDITGFIIDELKTHHGIMPAQCDHLLLELNRIVTDQGRNKSLDIIPHFKDAIARHKVKTAPRPDYIISGDESTLKRNLENKNHLLFTGNSLCGKTEKVKHIIYQYLKDGFIGLHTQNVDEAIRFLDSDNLGKKICLLEDPLGSISPIEGSGETFYKLKKLIQLVRSNKKIVVTSGIEVIQFFEKKHGQQGWIDLSKHKSGFLLELWDHLRRGEKVPSKLNQVVVELIKILLNYTWIDLAQIDWGLCSETFTPPSMLRLTKSIQFQLSSPFVSKFRILNSIS